MAYKVIQPRVITSPAKIMAKSIKRERPICSDNEDSDVVPRKQYRRVSKACERCRLKKTKCDGEIPCRRCTDDMVACCEGARRKGGPKTVAESCVELLEYQQTKLIAGHIKMYRMMVDAGIWSFGDVKKNSRGIPVVHDILEKLGVMRSGTELPNGFPESPDENRAVRLQLEAANDRTLDNEKDKFKQTTAESSPPSLVETDRESSIETCYSEVKPTVEISLKPPASRKVMDFTSESHQELNASSWKFPNLNNSRRLESISMPSLTPVSSSVSNSYDNYQSPNRQNPMICSNPWAGNGSDANQQFVISNTSNQLVSQCPVEGQNNYNILINSRVSFTNEEEFDYMRSLQCIDFNGELMPIGMKYGYDPYMG